MIKLAVKLASGGTKIFDFPNLGLPSESRSPQVDKLVPNPHVADTIPLSSLVGGHAAAYNQATRNVTNMRGYEQDREMGKKLSPDEWRRAHHHVARNKPLAMEEAKFAKCLKWLRAQIDQGKVQKLQYRMTRGAKTTHPHEMNEGPYMTREDLIEAVISKSMKTRLRHPIRASRHGEVHDAVHGKTRVYGAAIPGVGGFGHITLRKWRGPGKRPGPRIVTKSGRAYEQKRKKYVTKAIHKEVKAEKAGKPLANKWQYHHDAAESVNEGVRKFLRKRYTGGERRALGHAVGAGASMGASWRNLRVMAHNATHSGPLQVSGTHRASFTARGAVKGAVIGTALGVAASEHNRYKRLKAKKAVAEDLAGLMEDENFIANQARLSKARKQLTATKKSWGAAVRPLNRGRDKMSKMRDKLSKSDTAQAVHHAMTKVMTTQTGPSKVSTG